MSASDSQDVLSGVLAELKRAQKLLAKRRSRQITKFDDRDFLKSVAYAWFRSHRPTLATTAAPDLASVDTQFQLILEATDRASAKSTYISALKEATAQIRSLRAAYLLPPEATSTSDTPPDFSALVSDRVMQSILVGRWEECQRCLKGGAHLGATVMMGGLLEALFVARANAMSDKAPLFKTKSTPLDAKTKQPIPLKDWTLRPYLDVAHELGWITKSGKDIAAVLRDYRNLIHPEKQRALGVSLSDSDSDLFWEVTKGLSRQLLASASK